MKKKVPKKKNFTTSNVLVNEKRTEKNKSASHVVKGIISQKFGFGGGRGVCNEFNVNIFLIMGEGFKII